METNALNVFGKSLEKCSMDPLTGFYRDACCTTGVKPGDRWCLCALRWKEAFEAGFAPNVVLESTNIDVLKYIPFEDLLEYKHSTS